MNLDFLKDRESKYWFKSFDRSEFNVSGPLTRDKIEKISQEKSDPDWVRQMRLAGFNEFKAQNLPGFGPDLSGLDIEKTIFYSRPAPRSEKWEDLPEDIRNTFEKLGLTEKRKQLSGMGLQYDSEVVFKKAQESLEKLGVIYMSMDEAVREHPGLVRKYFSKLVPPSDNVFAALNSAVWSGGTFIYVPPHTTVPFPLHTYFRINMEKMGQFERTLIVVDEGAELTYVEGCTAPTHSEASLHAAVVEVFAAHDSSVKYITLQNWSKNVYNLVTKRARAAQNAYVQWVDGNFGSGVTMKYPTIRLEGEGAKGEVISIAVVSEGQDVDSGAGMVHVAPRTSSNILSKTISREGGSSRFRGFLKVLESSDGSRSRISCDSLLMGDSETESIPTLDIRNPGASVEHEAKMGWLDQEELFFLTSRGLDSETALNMLVFGFIREFVEELPLEYALELKRLIELDVEGQS